MKFLSISLLISFLSVSAFAKDQTLICLMGDGADMDISLTTVGAKDQLAVTLYGADGTTKTVFTNSQFNKGELSYKFANGEVQAVVSQSDLQKSFGGAYLDAGFLTMTYNKKAQAFDVLFAANSLVYTASCK